MYFNLPSYKIVQSSITTAISQQQLEIAYFPCAINGTRMSYKNAVSIIKITSKVNRPKANTFYLKKASSSDGSLGNVGRGMFPAKQPSQY
jgi:hypothetical protein